MTENKTHAWTCSECGGHHCDVERIMEASSTSGEAEVTYMTKCKGCGDVKSSINKIPPVRDVIG